MTNEKDREPIRSEDEHALDVLFEMDSKTLNKAVKRAKRRSTVRTLIISVLGSLVVIGGVQWLGQSITNSQQSAVEAAVAESYNVFYPDTFIGETKRFKGLFNGSVVYSTYKMIDGHVVYTGDHDLSYGLFGDSLQGIESQSILSTTYTADDAATPKFNLYGQREMVFYYPFLKYEHYRNDLQLLPQIDPGKKVEMALSFDKGYSIEDVRKMLPNQRITWFWVNDLTPNEMQFMQGMQPNQKPVCSERTAVGIKTIDENGQPLADPVAQFVGAVNAGEKNIKRIPSNTAGTAALKKDLLHVSEALKGTSGSIDEKRLTIFGVVVTGDVTSLKSLQGNPFIKASSLGLVADPY
jgi:hypothetical protein